MAGNVAGIGYGYPLGNYYNRVGLSTFMDDDCFSDYGIFNTQPYPMCGFGNMTTPYGYGNYQADYYKYMMDNLEFNNDYQRRIQQNSRNMELEFNAPIEGIQKSAAILNEKIMNGEQDLILPALEKYINSVRNAYPNANEQAIVNRASALYKQTYGSSLVDAVRENGTSSFKYGVLKGLTFGLYKAESAERNISAITGLPVSRKEKRKEIAGKILGVLVPIVSTLLLFKGFKGKKPPKTTGNTTSTTTSATGVVT